MDKEILVMDYTRPTTESEDDVSNSSLSVNGTGSVRLSCVNCGENELEEKVSNRRMIGLRVYRAENEYVFKILENRRIDLLT